MRKRQEFSRKIKAEAFARAKGKCENCGVKIRPGNGPEYDHIIPDAKSTMPCPIRQRDGWV